MIFDTDVLIWHFRGNTKAAQSIDESDDRAISIVTYMELLQGARDKREQKLIRETLSVLGFTTLPLTENISHRAAIYIEEHGLSTALCPLDALIAATAMESDQALITGNRKHFSVIKELQAEWFVAKT